MDLAVSQGCGNGWRCWKTTWGTSGMMLCCNGLSLRGWISCGIGIGKSQGSVPFVFWCQRIDPGTEDQPCSGTLWNVHPELLPILGGIYGFAAARGISWWDLGGAGAVDLLCLEFCCGWGFWAGWPSQGCPILLCPWGGTGCHLLLLPKNSCGENDGGVVVWGGRS